MRLEYRSFTEENLPDVLSLVGSRFGDSACSMVRKILRNPLLNEGDGAAGDIAYRDGVPVCFMATMVRRAYLRNELILCSVGGLFCKAIRGCPFPAMVEVLERMGGSRYSCSFGFGNTSSGDALGMNKQLGGVEGPDTWKRVRFSIIHPMDLIKGFVCRKLLKWGTVAWNASDVAGCDDTIFAQSNGLEVRRLMDINHDLFEEFWHRYLASNRGFVSSRSSAELQWMFGSELCGNKCVLLAGMQNKVLQGYIILRPYLTSPRRWFVLDWIACDNRPDILSVLLKGSKKFLRTKTNAWTLESRGFPLFAEKLVQRELPLSYRLNGNPFLWFPTDKAVANRIVPIMNGAESWFFGPYDGDLCL